MKHKFELFARDGMKLSTNHYGVMLREAFIWKSLEKRI